MEEIKITDYGIFNDAINNIKDLTSNLIQDLEAITNSVNNLDESSFLGPIKNDFNTEYNSFKAKINDSVDFFNNTEIVALQQFFESYKDSDKVNSERVGSV